MLDNPALLPISTDVVLFSIHHERLEALLVTQKTDCWGLPGGYAAMSEDLDRSALRHLQRQTGVRGVYLEQLYTFGCPQRNPKQRVVSVAYYALVPSAQLGLGNLNPVLRWFPLTQLPVMMLDHAEIVSMAHQRLVAKLAYSTIALQFMPERFTLSALQKVYETIQGETLDKRNFRKRVLALGCIEATDTLSREGSHRPARLYRVTDPGKIEFIK